MHLLCYIPWLMRILIIFLMLLSSAASTGCFVFYNKYKHQAKPIRSIKINATRLKKKLQKEPPAWMVKQIESDLKAYQSGITKQMLDKAFSGDRINTFQLIRFQIQGGFLSFSHDEKNLYSRHFKGLLACIKELNKQTKLPDCDFIVSLEDGFAGNPGIGPCFVFAKDKSAENLILVPDIKALTGYEKLWNAIPKANEKLDWSQKLSKGFWRGSSTGGFFTLRAFHELARAKLVMLSLHHPNEVDARFTSVVQCEKEVPPLFRAKGMISRSVSRPDHLRYKYLVDVDGNSCSYERLFWLLLSNSCVIKQVTPNVQWYYGALTPFEHFIPVKEDLSDLVEKIQWAKENDDEARSIAEAGAVFARENLTPEDTLCYLYHLIHSYAKLLKS